MFYLFVSPFIPTYIFVVETTRHRNPLQLSCVKVLVMCQSSEGLNNGIASPPPSFSVSLPLAGRIGWWRAVTVSYSSRNRFGYFYHVDL